MQALPATGAHEASLTAVEAQVLDGARAAVAVASREGGALLRVHGLLAVDDPWALLGADVGVAMDDPWSGLCFVGFGEEAAGHLDGVLGSCSQRREQVVEVGSEAAGAPAAAVALPFDATSLAGEWEGWAPVARVPSTVAWRRGEERGLVAQVWVRPGERPADVAARAAAGLERLSRRTAGASWAREVGAACPGLLARSSEPREEWCARVERALHAISAGALRKVVPARAVRLLPPLGFRFDPSATLDALRRRNPGALCFGVGGPGGWFLGASPELLLRRDGDRVESRPLAGTAARGSDPERDGELARALLESAKERREHRMVVDALAAALAPLCEDLRVAPPGVAHLPTMLHLETRITGRSQAPLLDLLARMHPTPAVGGWPREEALAWLRREEPVARGLFAGPVGWAAPGEATFALGIRAALVRPDEALAWAGAGVVRGSDPEAEWRETHLKLGVIREALCARRSRP
ncbi:MAG: hypothetical protein AMXMBFR64_39150 [Myxococcales bacterium]